MHELASLDEPGSWIRFTDKEDFKLYYRQETGFKGLTLYLEGTIQAPLMNIFAVLAEV